MQGSSSQLMDEQGESIVEQQTICKDAVITKAGLPYRPLPYEDVAQWFLPEDQEQLISE